MFLLLFSFARFDFREFLGLSTMVKKYPDDRISFSVIRRYATQKAIHFGLYSGFYGNEIYVCYSAILLAREKMNIRTCTCEVLMTWLLSGYVYMCPQVVTN